VMLTAQRESGFQQERREWTGATGVIARRQCRWDGIGVRLEGAVHQGPDRTQRQIKLSGDLRRWRAEAGHPSECQPKVQISRAWHRS
jgi:hypothetical protein